MMSENDLRERNSRLIGYLATELLAERRRIRQDLLESLPSLVAERLMVGGGGERAQRLVMEGDDRADLGGWCRSAVEDATRGVLRDALDLIALQEDHQSPPGEPA